MPFAIQQKKSGLSTNCILPIFKEYRLSSQYRFQKFPKHIHQLPQNHFLTNLISNPNAKVKTNELVPFISPNNFMKLYNKEFRHHNYLASEVYYHFETYQTQSRLRRMSAQQVFHFLKNQDSEISPFLIKEKIQEIMQFYSGEFKLSAFENYSKAQSGFVIPKNYFPLISIKVIKTSKFNDKKTQTKYVLLRFDQYQTSIDLDQNGYPKEFILGAENKPEKKEHRIDQIDKPRDVLKKQELKLKYNIKNFALGWFEKESPNCTKKELFQQYFNIQKVCQNLKLPKGQNQSNYNCLLIRKNPQQVVRLEIISILFNQIVIKLVIKLSDIKRVDFNTKNKKKEMYLNVKKQPQYFIHFAQYNAGQSIFNLRPWERVQNFPVEYQKKLANSLFFRNLISADSTICIDFATSRNQFGKVINYFQAQQLIQCEQIKQSPVHTIFTKYDKSYIFELETQFSQALSNVSNDKIIAVHCIKFSLLSLKNLYGTQITYEDMIDSLQKMEKEQSPKISQHVLALKMLCMKPNQLLSKPFETVYTKIIKRLEFWQKVQQKFPNIQSSDFLKLEQMLEMDDDFDEASTIQYIEESFLDQNSELLKMFASKIQKTKLILLPRIKITPNGLVYAGWTKQVASKVLKHFNNYEWQFMKCQIRNQNSKPLKKSSYIIQFYLRSKMSSIQILNQNYLPLGWSQSQLKQGILWYTLDSKELKTVSREEILQFLGDFDEKKHKHLINPALKAARIGQNFGSSWSFDATGINFLYQDDIFADPQKKKNFSDGIGCISPDSMWRFQEQLKLQSLAAIQIRYKGIKGLLSINKQLPQNTAIIRKSMVKYECTHPESVKYFDIIEVSRYKVGYLNRQIIMLLIQNGINSEYIYDLQKEYVDHLAENRILEVMLEYIAFDDETEDIFEREGDKMFESVAETIKMILPKSHFQKQDFLSMIITEQPFFKALKVEAKKKLINSIKQKARIRVQKSVRLFGILDQFEVLGEYEVYCSIQRPQEKKKFNVQGKCVLTKNPCMHPADLRLVTCVSDEEIQKRLKEKGKDPLLFEEILNVIVFPQKGKTPLTMEISQSDLDGDEFFLSWDQRIVPYRNLPPFVIAESVVFQQRPWTESGYEEMLDFFMDFLNFDQLGRLSNSHLVFGDIKGVSSNECIELCKYHSIAVQYPKRGYKFEVPSDLFFNKFPHFMEKEHPIKSYYSTSILGKIYNSVISMTMISHQRNDFQIFLKSKETYLAFIQQYVNLEDICQMNNKLQKRGEIRVNDILEKYLPDFESQFVDNQQNFNEPLRNEFDQPQMLKNAQEQQIQDKKFFTRQMVPFSIKTLKAIKKFIDTNPQANKLNNESPFDLIEILTAFNHLCIYQYELKSLVNFLQGHNESSYTVYFELHTSQQNAHDLMILERINQFRKKWFYFFAQELAADGIVKSVEEFETLYFENLIEKKPKFQDTAKSLKSMKGKLARQNFNSEINQIVNEFEDCDAHFIKEEIDLRKIVKNKIHYDVFRYTELKGLDPLIYRKMVLYFIVSTYFDKITAEQKIGKLLDLYSEYQRPDQGLSFNRISSRCLKFEQFRSAIKIFTDKKVDMLGFCWFCIPKLMVIWWKDIIKKQSSAIKDSVEEQKQQNT